MIGLSFEVAGVESLFDELEQAELEFIRLVH